MSDPLEPLLDIACQGVPFTAADGQAFVRLAVPFSDGFSILPVRSPAFRDWFFHQYYLRFDTAPPARAFRSTLDLLEALANHHGDNQHYAVFRRVGSRGPAFCPRQILLDLADPERRFVEISAGGWRVTAGENAHLQTSRSTATIPPPEPPPAGAPYAPLDTLRSAFHLSSRADWLRCLAWLLAALRPTGPFPVLILKGPPASGKSLAARILRSLIDPCASPLLPTPSSVRELVSLARHHWILAFDHISSLSPALAGTLCRVSSGIGAAVRETARAAPEPLLQYYKRPILLTTAPDWSCPADLAERALTVNFAPIHPDDRRTEAALLTACNQAWPGILAALCSAVATALTRLPQIDPPTGRCADALAWAISASPSLGCTENEMRQSFVPPPPPHPLVEAIRALVAQCRCWQGTATQLQELLPADLAPTRPEVLSKRVRSLRLTLANVGIQLEFRRLHGGTRTIGIREHSGDSSGDSSPENPPPELSPAFGSAPQTTETEELA